MVPLVRKIGINAAMDKKPSPHYIARETIDLISMSMDENFRFFDKAPRADQIVDQIIRIWRTVLSWKENAPEHMREEIERDLIQPRISQIEEWVYAAEQSPVMWDAMIMLLVELSATYRPIPPVLAEFAVRGLKGEIKRPTTIGRRPNTDRKFMICRAVRSVLNSFPDLKPTRHGDTALKTSACDIVAEVLPSFGIDLGRRSVEKIWEERTSLGD